MKQDLDKWLLHLDRPLSPDAISVERIPVVSVDLVDTGKHVVVLHVPSAEACHFYEGKLFVRGHGSCQTLLGYAAIEYIERRKQKTAFSSLNKQNDAPRANWEQEKDLTNEIFV